MPNWGWGVMSDEWRVESGEWRVGSEEQGGIQERSELLGAVSGDGAAAGLLQRIVDEQQTIRQGKLAPGPLTQAGLIEQRGRLVGRKAVAKGRQRPQLGLLAESGAGKLRQSVLCRLVKQEVDQFEG